MEVGNEVYSKLAPYGKYAIEMHWNMRNKRSEKKLLGWADSGGIDV